MWRLPATESRGGLVSIQPHTVPRGAAWLLECWHHIRVLDSRIAEENATLPYLEGEFSSPLPPHSPGWITWPCLATREAGKCNPLAPWLLAQPKSWSQEQLRKKERMANEHLAASPLDYHTCPTCFFLPSCFTDGHQNSAGVGTGQLFFHAILPALHESPVSGGEGSRGLLLGLGQHSGELRCGTRAPGFESWFGGSRSGGRSYSYVQGQRVALSSIREGCPLCSRPCSFRGGCTWTGEGGWGHPPHQPGQLSQPWRSMG